MLVNHAETERMGGTRIVDRLLAAADNNFARVRLIIAHDAFDERALAGAVLAEQSVKLAPRP